MKTSIKKMAAIISAAALSATMLIPVYAEDATVTARDAINSATSATIATAMSQYVVEKGKAAPYGDLPECDRIEINERILENAPYDTDEELAAAFQKALEYTTQVDLDWYDEEFLEDFSDGLDSSWTVSDNKPLVGNKALISTLDSSTLDRKSLNISGNDDMSMAVWGKDHSLTIDDAGKAQTGGKQYLTKTIDDPNVIITGYFNRVEVENNSIHYYEFRINDKLGYRVGAFGDKSNYVYSIENTNSTQKWKKIKALDTAWHKVEFDGATNPGYITAYFDGVEIFTVEATIETLSIGTFSSIGGSEVFFTDNITISKPKTAAQFLADVNSKEFTASSVKRAARFIGKCASLPECDHIEIAERLEAGKTYESIDEFTAAYQTALEYTTGVDKDNYIEAWSEDFSQGLDTEKWTIGGTLIEGAVGETQPSGISDVRQSLNISGTENASIGIFGKSITKDKNYITRTVENPESIVTVYFYDADNDKPRFAVYMNENCAITRTDTSGYYGYFVNGVGNASKVAATKGWHKVVFDGLTTKGVVTAYLDGNEIFQTDKTIEKIQVGNMWSEDGYGVYWVDSISVATEKLAEKVTVTSKGNEITALPASGSIMVQIDNWEKKTDYIVATYKDKLLVNVTLLTKDGTNELAKISTADIDEMKVFCWDSVDAMKLAGDMIHLEKEN